MSWGRKHMWPMERGPDDMPQNIQIGCFVLSPMVIRPHMAHLLHEMPGRYSGVWLSGLVWHVETGQSFKLRPVPSSTPIAEQDVYMVSGWYRLWYGTKAPHRGCFAEDRPWPEMVEAKSNELVEVV